MSDYGERLRATFGEASMETLDHLDDDVAEALERYVPHLMAMAGALREWPTQRRVEILVGMAMAAGFDVNA